jgi:threonine dehydrogenase-like Zn-dependent dehydrogenase
MKALVKTSSGIGNVEIKEMPRPVPCPEDILIKIAFCGLCGTDMHIYNDEYSNEPPVIIGHEFSGIVTEVGKSVYDFAIGDRVVGEVHTGACRVCWLCKGGYSHICPDKRPIGSKENGALAEYIKLPAWLAHKIPQGISLKTAGLYEPLAIMCHCLLEQAEIKKTDSLVILGASTMGLMATIVASKLGITNLAVVGTDLDVPVRFPLAKEFGACLTVNAKSENLKSIISDFAGPNGPETIIECSGASSAVSSAIRLIRRRGMLVLLGLVSEREISIPWNDILYKEIDIVPSFSSPASSWEKAIEMLIELNAGLGKIITHTIPLKGWQEGFELMRTGQAVKVMTEIGGEGIQPD